MGALGFAVGRLGGAVGGGGRPLMCHAESPVRVGSGSGGSRVN